MREYCQAPSNFRCRETLNDFLKSQGIIGVYGVDTREITKTIRESGVMNAVICDDPRVVDYNKVRDYAVADAVKSVSATKPQLLSADEHKHNVVLLDYGAKANIARELNKRGCNVAVMPYDTKAEDILALHPDGIMLSNGPGDPAENTAAIAQLKKLIGKAPIFGICLGHQLLALAMGCKTEKLKYGHRGVNQPVKDLQIRAHLYLQSKPRLCGGERYHCGQRRLPALGERQRRHLRRDRLPCPERLYGTVPSGGVQRAPRHPLFVRPIFTDDGRREPCR